jgi:GH18 family chitinase
MNLGYDCLDIDWEGRAPYNQTQMIAMADALKAHIGSKPLSYAVFPNNYSSHQTMTNIQSHVDKFDVMTFDFSTTSPPTVFNSPINGQAPYPSTLPGALSLEWNYQDFVTRGMAASKLNFGYEANGYLLSGTTGPWQNVSASVAGTPLYRNIVSTYASQITNPTRDPIAQMPWFQVGSNEWLNYDDPTSIAAKAAWAKSKGVGLFQWEASGDFVNGAHPLLSAMGTSGGPPPTPTPPTITSASPLTNGSTGSAYSQTLGASGSTPITWSITSGTLPTGLSLNSSTGAISGTPASTGTATFTVKATNALGNNSQQFTLTINSSSGSPTITTSSPLPPGTVGVVYSQ